MEILNQPQIHRLAGKLQNYLTAMSQIVGTASRPIGISEIFAWVSRVILPAGRQVCESVAVAI